LTANWSRSATTAGPTSRAVCERLLNGHTGIALVYVVFDVLELDGQPTTHMPFQWRRQLLQGLEPHDRHWQTSAVFDDGEALFTVAREQGLEGVVAKRLRDPYRPCERGWVKVKNRAYWRWELEREAAIRSRERAVR